MNRLTSAALILCLSSCSVFDKLRSDRLDAEAAKPASLRLQVASESSVEGWTEARDEVDRPLFVSPDVILTEFDVSDAASIHSETTHGVQLAFVGVGADRLEQFTRENVGRRLAIFVDDKVVTSPRIRTAVRDRAVISGDFTRSEAQTLAQRLRPPGRGAF